MATTIRLKRLGAKKDASYRIIVTDSREGTSGAAIERLGQYHPRTQPSMIKVNAARTLYWLHEGAEPSDTVKSLLKKTGVWKQFHDGVTAESVDQEVVFLGPPEGQRGTSQRPKPTDRMPKAAKVAAATAAAAAAEAPAAEPAASADEPAEESAVEAPVEEAVEKAAEEVVAEVAEAVEAPVEEVVAEADDEAEEAATDDAEEDKKEEE
jgi:small subunit ribosomal protein S16